MIPHITPLVLIFSGGRCVGHVLDRGPHRFIMRLP
jgi:hypothetical protein